MLKLLNTARTAWIPAALLSLVAVVAAEYHLAHVHRGLSNPPGDRLMDYLLAAMIVLCTIFILQQLRDPVEPLVTIPVAPGRRTPGDPRERRIHYRYAVNAPGALTIVSSFKEIPVVIVDIGAGGMCAATTDKVNVNTLVQFERQDCLYLGEVCYCNPVEDGFTIGVRFEHVLNQTETETLLHHLTKGRSSSPCLIHPA